MVSVRIPEKIEVPPTSELEIVQSRGTSGMVGDLVIEEAVKSAHSCGASSSARIAGHVPVRLVNVRSEPVTLYKV